MGGAEGVGFDGEEGGVDAEGSGWGGGGVGGEDPVSVGEDARGVWENGERSGEEEGE